MGEGRGPAKRVRLLTRGGGGDFKVAYLRKKKFFGPQNLKTSFFVQKKLLLLLCIDKCKLALSYK